LPIRKKLDEVAGRICKAVVPIRKEYFLGQGESLAICTLSSMDLLEKISSSEKIMKRIAIVGRLLSENKGIDAMIRFTIEHPNLRQIILCGQEVKGHKAGHALLSVWRSGVNANGRIIGMSGPYAALRSSPDAVEKFRMQVSILDMVGTTDLAAVEKLVA